MNIINVKGVVDEDFVNYKKPSMFITFPKCSWKCDKEAGVRVCQNGALASAPDIATNIDSIVDRYLSNPITKAIVIGGLEPFDSWDSLISLIRAFRDRTDDDIVIYTGYNIDEIAHRFDELKEYKNIIIKFGRYVPNDEPRYDGILGVELASKNQYAEVIS